MHKLLLDLKETLESICPTYIHLLPKTPYPYITIEPDVVLRGLPWGPCISIIFVKIWSRYLGTIEILNLAKEVEAILQNYRLNSLTIQQSSLQLSRDEQTRVHTFKLKVRHMGVA